MPIDTISQIISTIPEAGHRGVDVQTQFVIKQEDFQDHLQGTTVIELNALKTQINTTVTGMNIAVETVNTKASEATTKANEASASATSASVSASTATTKANEASTSANEATTQAGIATTKANEASTSASTATTQAGIATTKANEATTKANEATTQAGIATTKANEASTSASTATTQAGIATTKANEASTSATSASASATSASASATSATTSRNQAEAFAQQAQASAASVDVNNIVHRTDNETIAGVKTFSSSPIVPTPTTGTQAVNKDYVDSSLIPKGLISMWSGSITTIPTGWALCNGLNGTPNLQDRFVIGAGSAYEVGDTGGSKDAIAVSHTHTASVDTQGSHTHTMVGSSLDGTNSGTFNYISFSDGMNSGVNMTWTSSIQSAGAHSHTATINNAGSSGTNANLPPYYALAFIMKL